MMGVKLIKTLCGCVVQVQPTRLQQASGLVAKGLSSCDQGSSKIGERLTLKANLFGRGNQMDATETFAPGHPTGEYNENAQKLWANYISEAEHHDASITETWKSDMDSTLIFAGLFSATVTAFIIESYKRLSQDPNDVTTALLTRILEVQIATASGNTSLLQPTVTSFPPFATSQSAIAVNILWFLSLTCSLSAALCATLVQQWVRDYLQRIQRHAQPLRRARVRTFLFNGSEKWKMDQVVELIPILLHISLFLFFSGLFVFLFSINKAVTSAVALVVACLLCFYGFATIAPILDSAAPFETPLSSIIWHIGLVLRGNLPRRFKNMGIYTTTMADLANFRVHSAMHIPGDVEGATRQDAKALQWVYERIIDDSEFETFVESIPGFLSSADGCKTWRVASRLRGSTVWATGNRLFVVLNRCLTSTPNLRRTSTCLDALFALCLYYPRYGISTRRFTRQITIMSSWANDSASKAICIGALTDYSFLLPHCRYLDLPADIHELSGQVDDAVKRVDQSRCKLEEALRSHNANNQDENLNRVFSEYFSTVESAATTIFPLIEILNSIPTLLDTLSLLSWYTSLPRDRYTIILRNTSLSSDRQKFPLYAHQILAYMRTTAVLPALNNLNDHTTISMPAKWLQFVDTGVYRQEERKHLLRELEPFSMAIDILFPRSSMLDPVQDRGPAVRHLPSEPLRLPQPMSFADRGPFGSLALVLQDCNDGCKVTPLLNFVVSLQQHMPKAVDPSAITQTLDIVYPRQTPSLPEASQILFVKALHYILPWERGDPSFSGPFPFSNTEVTRLVSSLEHNVTFETSLSYAESAFRTLYHHPGIYDIKSETSSDLAPLSIIPNANQSTYSRSQSLYKYIAAIRTTLRK